MAGKKPERRGLGRGLSALMADVPDNSSGTRDAAPDRTVPVENIRPNPNQPRRRFTEEQLDDPQRALVLMMLEELADRVEIPIVE